MNRRLLSFALILACGSWAYACSSKSTDNPANPSNDGGDTDATPDTDSGQDGGGGDAATNVNPIDGIGAPAKITDTNDTTYFTSPKWKKDENLVYVAMPLRQSAVPPGTGLLATIPPTGGDFTVVRAGNPDAGTGTWGNAIDKNGAVINCELARIARTLPGGGMTDIATTWTPDGGGPTPFDTPRNLVARLSDNTIFFTDPGFAATPTANHVFRVSPTGAVAVIDELVGIDLPRPDGIALSKDEKTLYVSLNQTAGTVKPTIKKYTIATNGTVTAATTPFVELALGDIPEGLAIDDNDNLYVAYKAGVNVYKPDGTRWGNSPSIPTTGMGNVTGIGFGNTDRKTLFITTDAGKILSTVVNVPGLVN